MIGAMNMIRRYLAGLFMALFASGTWAQSAASQWITGTVAGTSGPGVGSSLDEACADALTKVQAAFTGATYTLGAITPNGANHGNCQFLRNGSTSGALGVNAQLYACVAGINKILTFGVGWATGPDDETSPNGIGPATWCDGSCLFNYDNLIGVYIDEEPSANGYYEITETDEYKSTGATCGVPSEPPENPDPEPPCGDGNCTPGGGDGDGDGDGDGGGDPGDGDGDGDGGDNPGGENPGDGAGGDGDGDGDGSGSGGGTGPGSGDGDGSGSGGGTGPGSGDGDGEEEGNGECGIPGKPACAVKVDETGTPTGSGAFSGVSSDGIGDALEGVKGSIQGVIDRDDNPGWTWTFQLPTGCTPLALPGYNLSIDVCQWQGMIHDIMSMLWVAATFWFLVGMFTKAGD